MVAPRKVGMGTLVMVGVVLDRSTPESFASFERAVAKLKCVLDCHLVAGDFDYFLKNPRRRRRRLQAHPWRPVDRAARRAPDPDVFRHEGSGGQRAAGFLRRASPASADARRFQELRIEQRP